ncbi:MAG: glycosyltransferase [Lachnospiraceae bacterium]|nr:glycosyltransferase [Lachnospiraceae bacterium]
MGEKTNNPLVSIIVPVYKVEKELSRCMQSILRQTYENIEIILVDDGSPDKCPEMCDKYAELDDRIRVIHKENGGLSDARNVGLDNIKGEYISFIDSDDWVDKKFIEILVKNLENTDSDIAICGYRMVNDRGETRPYTINMPKEVLSKNQALHELFAQHKYGCMACTKLYRKYLFENVRFPKGKFFEDIAVSLPVFKQIKRCIIVQDMLYYYFQRENSIVNSTFSMEKLEMLEFSQCMIDYSHRHGHKYDNEAEAFYLKSVLMILLQAYKDIKIRDAKKASMFLKKELKKHKKYIWNNVYIEKRRQIVMYAFLYRVPAKLLVKLWELKMKHTFSGDNK